MLTIGFKPFPITEIDNIDEKFDLEDILESFKKEIDIEKFSQQAKVIAFENTHNYNGGKIINTETISKHVIPKIKNSKIFNHLKLPDCNGVIGVTLSLFVTKSAV